MLAVPLAVHRGVVQPEVGTQIDDAHPARDQRRHELGGGAVRVGDDRRVDVGVAVEVELLEHQRHPVVGIELVQPPPGVGAGGDRGQLEGRDGGAAAGR